jgi:TP901 family phage tail tape measure protein
VSSNLGGAIGEATVRIRPDTSGFDSQVRSSVGASVRSVAKFAAGALVAGGLIRTVADQVGAAGALQKNLRESVGLLGQVGTQADRTFSGFQRQVEDLSREVGIAQSAIGDGLYEALGAGVPKENAFEFLRVASKASIAGVTDLDTAVGGLTTVINAFGLKASDAEAISDSLFQTVNAGKLTFGELSESIFNVAPVAAAANVSLQEVGAALATLTAGGVPASVATTQLRYAIQSLVAPSVKAEKLMSPVFKAAGFESGQAALKALGFKDALGLVVDAAGGSSIKLQRLVGSAEAVNAILTLTGKGSKLFADQLKAQDKAAGVTDKSLAQIERSAGRSFERAGNAARNFGLELGNAAAPAVATFADELTAGLDRISSGPGFGQSVQGIADGILGFLTDPQTIASAQTFGETAIDVFGAVRAAAEAVAPAVQLVATALGAVASSPVAPTILIAALAYTQLNRAVTGLAPKLLAVQAAQRASAATTAANAASTVSAIGLVGPSSARAATTAAGSFARIGSAVGRVGAGISAGLGGPVGIAVLGLSALAGVAFTLAGRESNAAQQAQAFNAALREQAAASSTASAALQAQKGALDNLLGTRVGVDQARQGVQTARTQVAQVQAAPATDFGGEAGKTQALTTAKNALAQAENTLTRSRQAAGVAQQKAVTTAQAERAAAEGQIAAAGRTARAVGASTLAQAQNALTVGINRQAAIRFAAAQDVQARATTTAAQRLQVSANTARQSARAVDTSTASGRKLAAQLVQEAGASDRSAAAARGKAIANAQASVAANRAIVASSRTTAAEKTAARERVKTAEALIPQLKAAGERAGKGQGDGVVGGIRAATPKVKGAGKQAGEAGAQAAAQAAPAAQAAGQTIGTNIGLGLIAGIDAQVPAAAAAGERLGRAAADATKRGARTGSPSKITIETGRDVAEGLAVGVQLEQGRTSGKIASSTTRAIAAAAAAGVRNARTQGGSIAEALADGFRIRGGGIRATITTAISSALRDSIVTAQQNLAGFASSVADLAGRAIDAAAPDFTARSAALDARGAALQAASAADQERTLRNAVALAEAGAQNAQARYAALQASIARRTPAQDARLTPLQREQERQRLEAARLKAEDPAREERAALDAFLLQADRDRLTDEQTQAQAVTDARKAALTQQLADLAANLNAGQIKVAEFNAGVTASLAANGVNIAAVGAQLGTAYVAAFNLALGQLGAQGKAVGKSPGLPAGFIPGIERPAQVAIAEAITTRNVLRSALATELGRVRTSQEAQRQALQATFTKESSAGGARIVASEQRQLNARAAEHKAELRELKAIGAALVNQPPTTLIETLVAAGPGADPATIGAAVARALTNAAGNTARRARR